MITEKNNVFYCDCGFSFERGRSGTHDCGPGLRKKLAESERYGRQTDITIDNLEMKLAQMAAENANARNALQAFCDVVGANTDAICDEVGQNGVRTILAAMSATGNMPATDAFLAEVRAQGVERLAKAWYAIANETGPGISISDSSRLKYRQRADDAADFANEIRQEAAQ